MASKAERIEMMAEAAGITKSQASAALDAFIGSVWTDVKKGGRAAITGLGTLSVGHRAARKGRNPATGEAIKIKASNTVKFKAAPDLKEVAAKFKVPK